MSRNCESKGSWLSKLFNRGSESTEPEKPSPLPKELRTHSLPEAIDLEKPSSPLEAVISQAFIQGKPQIVEDLGPDHLDPDQPVSLAKAIREANLKAVATNQPVILHITEE